MDFVFTDHGWEDYLYWQNTDRKILKKINILLKDIQRNPYSGLGSPEQLKHSLTGYWSRRITLEHRLVYRVDKERIRIIQCRLHY